MPKQGVDKSVDSVRKKRRKTLELRKRGPLSSHGLFKHGTEKDVRDRMRKKGEYRKYRANMRRIRFGDCW